MICLSKQNVIPVHLMTRKNGPFPFSTPGRFSVVASACSQKATFTARNSTINILKVLERGPLRFVKVALTKHLGDIYNFKGHLL